MTWSGESADRVYYCNSSKSLLGIETESTDRTGQLKLWNCNSSKSLLGIETIWIEVYFVLSTNCNSSKSLLGIET